MPSDPLALEQPLKDGAIRTVNFFNGRLLTGADLGREQAARREADSRLGQALGDGIAGGLDVTLVAGTGPVPVVSVNPGIAVNRLGATLVLPQAVTLAIDRTASPDPASISCLFGDCAPPVNNGHISGSGLFLLTIAPAFASEGRAQVSGLGDVAARCAIDATIEAIQFRTIEIAEAALGFSFGEPDPGSPGKTIVRPDLRNRIAYRCFGAGVGAAWPADLLGQDHRGDDLISQIRGNGLEEGEVPLALFAFGPAGSLLFVDSWSVRREIAVSDGASLFAALAEPRRTCVGRAMFRQFQSEVQDLDLAATRATERFARLPPAGFLTGLDDAGVLGFFAGMTVRGPLHIDAAAVEPLLRESFAAPAIDTASPHALWFYRIAETRMAGNADIAFFASGHLPYRADARFDLSHFDFANYALIP